jgi:hypothetical protein
MEKKVRLPWVPAGVEYDDPIGRHCPCKTEQVRLGKEKMTETYGIEKKQGVRRIIREINVKSPNKGLMKKKENHHLDRQVQSLLTTAAV